MNIACNVNIACNASSMLVPFCNSTILTNQLEQINSGQKVSLGNIHLTKREGSMVFSDALTIVEGWGVT